MTNLDKAAQMNGLVKPRDLADELKDAGLLMPDLPKPEIGAVSGIPRWNVDSWVISYEPNDDSRTNFVWLDNDPRMTKPYVFTPQGAKEFALTLLAVADYAEKEQDNGL